MRERTWERIIDITVLLTAIGMAFLIVFALLATANRNEQIANQLKQNEAILEEVTEVSKVIDKSTSEHQEAALRHHCATAQLIAREDGDVSDSEDLLVRLACRH